MNVHRYTLLKWFAVLTCGVWLGMLVFLGAAVAPAVFRFLDSKTQAGLLNGIILHKMNVIEGVCALVLLLNSIYFVVRKRERLRVIQLTGSLLVLLNLIYYSMVITPQMGELKQTIQNFDVPRSQDARPEREEFDRLHKKYSAMVTANIVLLLMLSFLIAHASTRDEV